MNLKLCIGRVALFFFLLTSCSDGKESTVITKEIPVKIVEVKTSGIGHRQNYVGTVEETFSSTLSFEVEGNISHIYVREGQKVYVGQLLASLNQSTLKNNYDAIFSTLKQVEDTYNRMKVLYENNSLPEIKWIEVQTSLQQAQSMESIAKKNLNDCNLFASFSGVITERNVESGTNVMPGMPAFKLVRVDKVKVKIAVPEKEISHTLIGQQVNIQINALGEKYINAQITEKNVIANPLSHTYEVKIALDNPAGDLMPGMICNVNIHREEIQEKMIIPPHAVQVSHTGENFVWIAIHGCAKRRVVQIGGLSDEGTIISSGLTVGEQVIVEGNQKVSEGMKIVIR